MNHTPESVMARPFRTRYFVRIADALLGETVEREYPTPEHRADAYSLLARYANDRVEHIEAFNLVEQWGRTEEHPVEVVI